MTPEEKIAQMKFILGEEKFKEWVNWMLSSIEAFYSEQPNKHPYTVGVLVHKNEWPIPQGTKLGKRPAQRPDIGKAISTKT